jgi:hypothetical protein
MKPVNQELRPIFERHNLVLSEEIMMKSEIIYEKHVTTYTK